MKLYFLKNNTGLTYSELPLKENGEEGIEHEVSQDDYDSVKAGTHYFDFVDGKPNLMKQI